MSISRRLALALLLVAVVTCQPHAKSDGGTTATTIDTGGQSSNSGSSSNGGKDGSSGGGGSGKASNEAEEQYSAKPILAKVQEHVEADRLIQAQRLLKEELKSLKKQAEKIGREKGGSTPEPPSQYLWLSKPEATGATELMTELGKVYQRQDKQAEGLGSFEEACDILRYLYTERDPRYGMAADKYADALVQHGDHALAITFYRQVLSNLKRTLGVSHPGYQLTLSKMASAAKNAGKDSSATKAYAEMLELMNAELASSARPGTAGSSAAGGGEGGAGGGGGGDDDDPDGEHAAREEERKAAFDEGKVGAAAVRVQYARSLAGQKKYVEALKEAEKARDEYAASAAANSLEHAASLNGVAGTLEKLGRDDEAIGAMEAAYKMAEKAPSADASMVSQAKRNLDGLRAHVKRKRAKAKAKAEL